jgi:hypothetical protein
MSHQQKPDCARCHCPEAKHCKGGIVHVGGYKPSQEYVTTCVSRHCLTVLCSCVDYIAPDLEPEPKQVAA